MSDSIIVKENISYRKKKVVETSSNVVVPNVVQFAHRFNGGESSFNLLSLTTPTAEMPGFTNPSPAVLAGQNLSGKPSSLKLHYMATGARMVEFDSYRCFGTNIVFLGNVTMPAGAVIYGEIAAVAANPIVVGDGRFQRKTYVLPAGQATLNLGFTYKVGAGTGTGDQVGDIKVTRNGLVQLRNAGNVTASANADGNYQEVDAGNGYGSTIVFNVPPSGQADSIVVEMGFQISSGQLNMWSELERLQGGLQALATDSAQAFGNPVSNYLSTNPTELERRTFGDQVIDARNRLSTLEGYNSTYISWNSGLLTPVASAIYMPGQGFTLPVGDWMLVMSMQGSTSGGATGYVYQYHVLSAGNGNNTAVAPPGLPSTMFSLGGYPPAQDAPRPTDSSSMVLSHTVFVRVTAPTLLYHVPYVSLNTPANARVSVSGIARRIG